MESKKKNKRPKPYDEMSTTGALSSTSAVERSYRPIARPERKSPSTMPRGMEINETTPIGQPLSMGERMRMQEIRQERASGGSGHQGRPAKKFKDGGMVRGCKPGQSSGTKFTGTF